ncbi:hypothetical protein C1O66_07470 [Paucibacter aquatile]|uniref:GIY-YIG domain-containing protein n=2 Tax=Kinneretia aquatilis TaxID=2070761 RepID=A0A2N8KVF4_9BURK|nr:hypothetical protein C1O66_07470 [Paucibacter aquatile]
MSLMKYLTAHLPESPGIYVVLNVRDGRRMVGVTKNVRKRATVHFGQIKAGKCQNRLLRRAAELAHFDDFQVICVQEIDGNLRHAQRAMLEYAWAVRLRSCREDTGYNLAAGAHWTPGARFRVTEERMEKFGRYMQLSHVDHWAPINEELLASWCPGVLPNPHVPIGHM